MNGYNDKSVLWMLESRNFSDNWFVPWNKLFTSDFLIIFVCSLGLLKFRIFLVCFILLPVLRTLRIWWWIQSDKNMNIVAIEWMELTWAVHWLNILFDGFDQ